MKARRLSTDRLGKRTAVANVLSFLFLMALFLTMQVGCDGSSDTSQRRIRSVADEAESGDDLLSSAIQTLNALDDAVDLQLRPAKVVLDSITSRNGKTVFATITLPPRNSQGQYNFLRVVSRNGSFRRLKIRPGDHIRYYALRDEQGKVSHIELIVGQVVGNNELALAGGLNQAVLDPQRMEIWRYVDEKMQAIRDRMERYASRKRGTLGWEPSPDEAALHQVVDHLNGWVRRRGPTADYSPSPLVAKLPKELRRYASEEDLALTRFVTIDGRRLQESVWLRDISAWAAGRAYGDLELAKNLFDWTVRHIQLETAESLGGEYFHPWHALLYGRGTAKNRASVFARLAREQGLDVVILGIRREPEGAADFWCPALLSGEKLYLFDSTLGIPIPGAAGEEIASLASVLADPDLLRRLDLSDDEQGRYPVGADDLGHLVAMIDAAPFSLSRRAAILQSRLVGEERFVVSFDPATLVSYLEKIDGIGSVQLWEFPFRTIAARRTMSAERRAVEALDFLVFATVPRLWKGRVLQFQGEFFEGTRAKSLYRRSRPTDSEIEVQIAKQFESAREFDKKSRQMARAHATYWLGLMAFDEENFEVALDFLKTRTLDIASPGPWKQAARYNLARTYEALGKKDQAIELYESDDSPGRHGSRLRARWLRNPPSEKGRATSPEVTTESS